LSKPITYKDAGVDIEKAENALGRVKQRITETYTPEVLSGVGLFGSFFDISGFSLQQPVLASSTDGVGTKLKVAMFAGRHNTVGQDLVNHCINDIAVCGAKPLFFLDYFASGNLHPEVYEQIITGLSIACGKAGVPLIGGETAEMPDFYQPGEYDMCGTVVGIVEKSKIINGQSIRAGDILIGVSGNGLHTNGYTLARRVLLEKYRVFDFVDALGCTLAEELLKIHPNYYPLISAVVKKIPLNGISHITGGGIVKNTNRLLPKGLLLEIDWDSWPVPPVFNLIQTTGNVPVEDMRQTFNMGIGLIFIIDPQYRSQLLNIGKQFPYQFYEMGKVSKN
jgi:phosphoribosylformylglycinamidine cyclo-ligase